MQGFNQEQKVFLEDLFSKLNITITEKTNSIRKELKEQFTELKANVEVSTAQFEKKIKDLEVENKKLQQSITRLERKVRKNNLIIFGINAEERDVRKCVLKVFHEIDTNVDISDLNDVFRIKGKSNSNPVVVEFLSLQQKLLVLKNAHKLKGRNIFISNDKSSEDRKKDKVLIYHQKLAREKGLTAYIRGGKLYIGNEQYEIDQLQNSECEALREEHQTVEKSNSAPSTPNHVGRQGKLDEVIEIQVKGNLEENQAKQTSVHKAINPIQEESSATRYTRSNSKRI